MSEDLHKETGVTARLDDEAIGRLDTLASDLTKRNLGINVSRAAVVKAAILRGLDVLERDARKPTK